ncbi:MAG: HAD family hydrolase [Treponema sp.]|nr:HAD family hydrolase [Treponema sp.]
MKFSALAFDLDGTLYPAYRLNFRLIPFVLKEQRHMRAMDKARKYLRKGGAYEGDFYEKQAALMAQMLGESGEKVKERNERLIYRGWEPLFKKVRPFPHLRETLDAFRGAGIRMGLLSDFPPETKLENLKLSGYWDVMLCSEVVGRLKPDPASFLELARRMETPAEQILYVGNSVPYDVGGARNAGMKAALIRPRWKRRAPGLLPDFVFHDYRQLRDYVLN